MSDHYIELIPRNHTFVPSQEGIRKAVQILEGIAPDAETVKADKSEHVVFRDCGGISCRLRALNAVLFSPPVGGPSG
jgi:hypothetical protein